MIDNIYTVLKGDPNTANAISAAASAIIAVLALVVSVVSVAVSLRSLRIQRRHNVSSIRPLPEVTVADYEDSIRVKLRNTGSGPMIVKSLAISNGTELTRDSWCRLMFPKIVEHGDLEHGETTVYGRGDHPQAA